MTENKAADIESNVEWYISNRPRYKKLGAKIQNIVTEVLETNELSYHIITHRAKEIESYRAKISDSKYDDPINQIKDLAGIRIITYVEDEVGKVNEVLEQLFEKDEANSLDKSKELGTNKVGYKSVHFVGKLKEDRLRLPEYGIFRDSYFEIQVRTILQHAWAEIEHDRNYKFAGKLPEEISRRFSLLAGILEMSDREFNSIARDIDQIANQVEKGTKEGNLDFPLNSTSLRQYIETKFEPLKARGFTIKNTNNDEVLKELESFGIKTLSDLDKLTPPDFIENIVALESEGDKEITETGLIRSQMIINDSDKYFGTAKTSDWTFWSKRGRFQHIFNHYKVDWDRISERYHVTYM